VSLVSSCSAFDVVGKRLASVVHEGVSLHDFGQISEDNQIVCEIRMHKGLYQRNGLRKLSKAIVQIDTLLARLTVSGYSSKPTADKIPPLCFQVPDTWT
jgi:hypothetical protein